jgi:hypothetical protein
VESELLKWVENELAEANQMLDGGSYDGDEYWRGRYDVLMSLKGRLNA